ncbi:MULTISPECIES: SMC family ATPase [Rhodococcus]|uniref:Nuclease SbcCD subunit C n=1 Tax=Rhodococcus cerastii TaxID=908616 RepID=A0ABU4D1Z3_9NOCA|nr:MULTISPECIES: SMC family ATPase [Rhodococcus]MDV6303740.1 SMC family ATPase [Rhodococcus cerastii]MDV8058285.1 SMC family ATPase [Rhodococcus sp. IEGM 1343]
MRLHSLEITAFGPFAGTETVDFDALGADGLFLLHGQTGAGKTTVLDAVAFALYGTVPGARREGKRLLSDHAAKGAVPQVTLEATLAGRRIRIVRSPEFLRPKLRSTGTTKQHAKASLTWLDGRGQNLTRLNEIGDAVNALLGMSADQFFQVVLLPQGEFARFLRADSDERGNLLERLFDTGRFGDVEEWFAQRRRELAAELADAHHAIDIMLGRVSQASGIPEPAGEDGEQPDPLEWAADVLADARQNRTLAQGRAVLIDAAARRASAALTKATIVLDLQRRRALAEAQLVQYREGETARAARRTELADSADAGPIAATAADLRLARRTTEAATSSLAAAERALPATAEGRRFHAALHWPPAPADPSDERTVVAQFVRDWTTDVARLQSLLGLAREADRLDGTLVEYRAQQRTTAAAIERTVQSQASMPEKIAAVESRMARAASAVAELPGLEERCSRARAAAESALELVRTRATLAEAERVRDSARAAHNTAWEHLLDLRERRLDGMAAELAARLEAGEPCVVCGSEVHPHPAAASTSTVTKAQEDKTAAAERKAAAVLDQAVAVVARAQRDVDLLHDRTGGASAAELAQTLDAATTAVQDARARAADVEPATAELDRLRSESDALTITLHDLVASRSAVDERIAATEESLTQMRASVAEEVDEGASLADRIAEREALIDGARRIQEARIAWLDATARADSLAAELDRRVEASNFESVDAAAGAVLTADRVEQIETELRTAEETRAHAEHVLREPTIVDVAGRPPVDLAPLEQACAEMDDEVRVAAAAVAECRRRADDLERLIAELFTAAQAIAPQRAEFDELANLADVVAGRGQNARKMSLRSYVLASRLEDVAESASARLRRMSSGRYEFVHSDEAGVRGKRGGLGLDIRDDYTGVVRSAKTLSGGEAFLASLSLALGLADVVAAESGGVVLDTMFIDEGFGTLDADTLESVMAVLDELRAGGRVVGVVSHVDEMRQRIPSRLYVKRERTGSTLQVVAS